MSTLTCEILDIRAPIAAKGKTPTGVATVDLVFTYPGLASARVTYYATAKKKEYLKAEILGSGLRVSVKDAYAGYSEAGNLFVTHTVQLPREVSSMAIHAVEAWLSQQDKKPKGKASA